MHVPYSMDDSEPDLHCGMGGSQVDREDQIDMELKPVPMYVFYNVEELVTSEVFQRQLSMALKSKDKQIDELRNENLDLHAEIKERLNYI